MPRLSKRERLRRDRIGRALRAYHREQRRVREARVEAARHYWRRVKLAAGRHGLTVAQAKRAIRVADQQAIPVRTAARRVKRLRVVRPPVAPPVAPPAPPPPPPPPVPVRPPELAPRFPLPPPEVFPPPLEPPEPPLPIAGEVWASSDVTREEIAWNLRDVVDQGYEVDPRDVLAREGTLEAEFNVFVDGQYVRTQRVEFESSRDPDDFWYNFHAAAREVHEDTMSEEVDYDQISITAMAIRMA